MRIYKTIICNVVSALLTLFVPLLLVGCGVQQRTEVVSASIEESSTIRLGVSVKAVRIEFAVYNCKDLQSTMDSDDIREWLSNYAHCYNDSEELELDGYILFEDKNEKKHTFIADWIISHANYGKAHDTVVGNLRFVFSREGLETNYDGEFTNNYD